MRREKASIPMRNGHNLVVEISEWNPDEPAEIFVYFEHDNIVLQDIAIVREHKTKDAAEVLVYADHNNEDYTHKFIIEKHSFEEDN